MPTFGIGHLIKSSDPEHGQPCGTPVSTARVISAFNADATSHVDGECFRLYPNFDTLPDFVQLIVADMIYNMGYGGLSAFSSMKKAVLTKDYDTAADEMQYTKQGSGVESKWYKETGNRAKKLVSMMRNRSTEHGYSENDINTTLCNC